MTKNEKWIIGGVVAAGVVVLLIALAGVAFLLTQAKPQVPSPKPSQTLSVAPMVDVKTAQALCEGEARNAEELIWQGINKPGDPAFGYVLSSSFPSFVLTAEPKGKTAIFTGTVTSEIRSGSITLPATIDYTCSALLDNGKWIIDAKRS